jgi:hypothetical protein
MSSLPTEIPFNGQTILMKTYAQLEQLSRQNLKIHVKTLQDQLDGQGLPPVSSHSPEFTIAWILNVQCAVCMGKGLQVSPKDFGAPATDTSEGYFGCGEAMPRSAKGSAAGAPAPMKEHDVNAQAAYEDAVQAANATRARNMGSNIFG